MIGLVRDKDLSKLVVSLYIFSYMAVRRAHALCSILLAFIGISLVSAADSYVFGQEQDYLANFNTLIKDSFSMPRPAGLNCATTVPIVGTMAEVAINVDTDAAGLQSKCGTSSVCVIQPGVTVTLNGNVNVAAIINLVYHTQRHSL